jgi:hypothetical protein
VAVHDVSIAGIGLWMDKCLVPGTLLHVDLPENHGISLLACVAHARCVKNGTWALGCSFIRDLTEQELRRFLGQ